jgi:hypothetical protein
MTAFLEALYRIKARELFRTPLMLFLDEADAIAPQKPQEDQARMLGAAEDIVRRGGQRGLGCTLITQRSAVLNKNVLTQAEMIVALRTIAPQDLKAMDAWVEVHGEREQRDTLMSSLPALPQGDAWFWSPGWPTADGIFQRVHVLPIETFDSGASPKAGEKRIEPKNLADVDLGALTKQMAATIEKAKANDPKLLRQRIAELERAVKAAPAKSIEKPVVDQRAIDRAIAADRRETKRRLALGVRDLGTAVKSLHVAADAVKAAALAVTGVGASLQVMMDGTTEDSRAEVQVGNREQGTGAIRPSVSTAGQSSRAPARPIVTPRPIREGLNRGKQRILDGLAELKAIGIPQPSRTQLSIVANLNLTGGSGSTYVGELTAAGLVEIPEQGKLAITPAGEALAAPITDALTNEEVQRRALDRLNGGERRILEYLLREHPERGRAPRLAKRSDSTSPVARVRPTSASCPRSTSWSSRARACCRPARCCSRRIADMDFVESFVTQLRARASDALFGGSPEAKVAAQIADELETLRARTCRR